MLSIDGVISGIDTTSIIQSLLSIQERQVNTLDARRAQVVTKQAAFSAIEARLISFRSALNQLSSNQSTTLRDKKVTSSDESVVLAAASDSAANGTYQLYVNQLAAAHQVATTGFSAPTDTLGHGTLEIQVGSGSSTTITIDSQNDTLEGAVAAINRADAGVTASIINDGSGATSYRLLLTAKDTGAENEISFTSTLTGGSDLAFDFDNPLQAAQNAQVRFGSATGGILVESDTNRFNELIEGVTLNLQSADASKQITLNVAPDLEAATTAVQDVVDEYNGLIDFINSQVRYVSETDTAGPLNGDRQVISLQDQIRFGLTGVVSGLAREMNRLSAVGITVEDNGKLSFDQNRLEDALNGDVSGVSADDVARLFSLSGSSSNRDISFVVGSSKTGEGQVGVNITAAATGATVTGASPLSNPVFIFSGVNDTMSLVINGNVVDITLDQGVFSPDQIATQVQSKLAADEKLQGVDFTVSLESGALQISTDAVGSTNEIKLLSGTAWNALGFNGDELSKGTDVEGYFVVNGEIEEASGRGTLLIGDVGNQHTADLQVRVNLTTDDVVEGNEASVTVTRGLASRMDKLISEMLESDGLVKTINERFTQTEESIQASIDRVRAQVAAQQESLIRQFAAMESALSDLQATGSYLGAQSSGLGSRLG